MSDIYQENILDHYNNPRNNYEMIDCTHKAKFSNLVCGDEIVMYFKVENGIITKVSFTGSGCALSIATASILTEYLINNSVADVLKLKYEDLLELIKIQPTPSRSKCVLSSLEASRLALKV